MNTEGPWRQISRLGNPLVNEVIIPLGLKDASYAGADGRRGRVPACLIRAAEVIKYIFGAYRSIRWAPVVIDIPPPPRNDLAQIFATGIPVTLQRSDHIRPKYKGRTGRTST